MDIGILPITLPPISFVDDVAAAVMGNDHNDIFGAASVAKDVIV